MTKIAIISQPESGMLIDVGGCSNAQEAAQHLSSTFQDPTRFWESNQIDISFGKLALSADDASEFATLITERGVRPRNVFAALEPTRAALAGANVTARDASSVVDCSPPPARRKTSQTVISIAVPGGQPESWYAMPSTGLTATAGDEDDDDDQTTPSLPLPVVPTEKHSSEKAPFATPQVLYLHQTLRSGQTVNHKGNLVIIGDVNNGAEVIAEGDILVWGALRGIAHAGSAGNEAAEIRALKLAPLQLRIAQSIARAPDKQRAMRGKVPTAGPELARIVDGQIRISYNAPE
jgi:septum formation inhibitor MinC